MLRMYPVVPSMSAIRPDCYMATFDGPFSPIEPRAPLGELGEIIATCRNDLATATVAWQISGPHSCDDTA